MQNVKPNRLKHAREHLQPLINTIRHYDEARLYALAMPLVEMAVEIALGERGLEPNLDIDDDLRLLTKHQFADLSELYLRSARRMKTHTLTPEEQTLRDEAVAALEGCAENPDAEAAHTRAEEILLDLLSNLGFNDVVKAYGEAAYG